VFHRGIQGILEVFPTWELWNMKNLRKEVLERASRLRRDPCYRKVCAWCNQGKGQVAQGLFDASAFYEQVAPRTAILALAFFLLSAASWLGLASISVAKTIPMTTKLGGLLHPRIPSFFPAKALVWTLTFVEIYMWFGAFISVNVVEALDAVWMIAPGATAIGSPFGRVCVALVSGRQELEFDHNWRIFTAGTPLEGTRRNEIFAALKYVDDLWLLSYVICISCLTYVVGCVYTFSFKLERHGRRSRFLDATVRVDNDYNVTLVPVLVNYKFLRGRTAKRDKVTSPPWWRPFSVTILAGLFKGMLVRWAQLFSCPARVQTLAWLKTCDFILLGYPYHLLRGAWRKVPDRATRRLIVRCLHIARRRNLFFLHTDAVTFAAQETVHRLSQRGIPVPQGTEVRGTRLVPLPETGDPSSSAPMGFDGKEWGKVWQPKKGGGKGGGKGATNINVTLQTPDPKKKEKKRKKKKDRKRSRSSSSSSTSSSDSDSSSDTDSNSDSGHDKKKKKKKKKKSKKEKKGNKDTKKDKKTRRRDQKKYQKQLETGISDLLKENTKQLGEVVKTAAAELKSSTSASTMGSGGLLRGGGLGGGGVLGGGGAGTGVGVPSAAVVTLRDAVIHVFASTKDLTGILAPAASFMDVSNLVHDACTKNDVISVLIDNCGEAYSQEERRRNDKGSFVRTLIDHLKQQNGLS